MQHVHKSKNSKETLEKRIDGLLDDPLDKRLLIDIMSFIVSMDLNSVEDLEKIPHLKSVDKILKDHLKRETIPLNQL